MSASQSAADSEDEPEYVWRVYPRVSITPEAVAEHFGANISVETAVKLQDTFGDDLCGLASVIAPQLRDAGFSPGVITALFHGQPDHKNQTIAHRHKQEGVGGYSGQDTLSKFS